MGGQEILKLVFEEVGFWETKIKDIITEMKNGLEGRFNRLDGDVR